MGIQSRFNDFHNRIRLSRTDENYKKAREKDDSITEEIVKAFRDKGYEVKTNFLQGSLSTDTAVIHEEKDFDIDRAIIITKDSSPDDPVEPKLVIYDILGNRGFKNHKVKTPCVTADYIAENLHIDFTVYREAYGSYELALGKTHSNAENKIWSPSDPLGLKDWIKENSTYGNSADKKQQQFNRIVRYLKRWRDHQFSHNVARKIFSIGITVMAKETFFPVFNDEGFPSDLDALKNCVDSMLLNSYFAPQGDGKYSVTVMLPKSPCRDIFHGSSNDTGTQFKNKLDTLKTKLSDALAETDEIEQCKILNKLFGDDFEIPESTAKAAKTAFATAGSVGTSQGA